MPPFDLRKQNSNAYSLTAIAGLLILALHTMGMGALNPSQVITPHAIAFSFPEVWPYLVLTLGVFAQRRWARDLAAPTACLALVAALAAFPRYLFLDLGYARMAAGPGPAHPVWQIFRPMLLQQAAFAALCAGTLYALTRPSLVAQYRVDPKQPTWTDGLSFAALLPLSHQFFTASDSLNVALYRFPDSADLGNLASGLGSGAWFSSPAWASLAPCGLAILALTALIGLWKRRFWGWLAMLAQTLLLGWHVAQSGLSKALTAFTQFQDKAPAAAPYLAGEAFCRILPDLAVLLCLLAALLICRRQFRP